MGGEWITAVLQEPGFQAFPGFLAPLGRGWDDLRAAVYLIFVSFFLFRRWFFGRGFT